MEKQQIGLITSVVVNVVLAVLLIFFIFKLNASAGTAEGPIRSPAAKALLAPDLECVKVTSTDALIIIDVQNDFMPERPYTVTSPRHEPPTDQKNGANLKAGSLAVAEAKDIVSHINPLIDVFEAAKGTIIYSLDWHPTGHCSHADPPTEAFKLVTSSTPNICRDDESTRLLNESKLIRWPVHCVQGTWGAQFDPHLKISTSPSTFIIKKGFWPHFDSYSAFGGRLSTATDMKVVDSDANWEVMETQGTKRLTDILKEKKIQRAIVVGIATNYCVKYTLKDGMVAEFNEIPGLALATVKEALGSAGATEAEATADRKALFTEWPGKGIAVLSEKNKQGKPLFNTTC